MAVRTCMGSGRRPVILTGKGGACEVCHTTYRLRKDGMVRTHRPPWYLGMADEAKVVSRRSA